VAVTSYPFVSLGSLLVDCAQRGGEMHKTLRFINTVPSLLRVEYVCRELSDQFSELPWENYDRPQLSSRDFLAYASANPNFFDQLIFISSTLGEANVHWFSLELKQMPALFNALIRTEDDDECATTVNSVHEFVSFGFEEIVIEAAEEYLGKIGSRIIEALFRAELANDFFAEHTDPSSRESLNETQRKALDEIGSRGPIKGILLASRLRITEGHLRSRVLPALRPFGLRNDRSLGGYVIRLS
jgi:hypothetical protein